MKTTAISKLKASLSEYLSWVKAGEEIIVTDHGKPVAKIIPLTRDEAEIPAEVLALERAGLARIGTGELPKEFWGKPRPTDRQGLARRSLIEEREGGR